MTDPLTAHGPKVPTPQSQPALPDQVQNNAGGWVFTLDPMTKALRFLILGTTGGTYYATQADHTKQAAEFIIGLANNDEYNAELLRLVREVSMAGRAPKQNPTLFTLAALSASTNDQIRAGALEIVSDVCRTSTMLFQYTTYLRQFRGMGRGARTAIGRWYTDRPVEQLAYQAIKYRQREGWTHRDLLRLSHPITDDPQRKAAFDWICGRDGPKEELFEVYEQAQTADPTELARLVSDHNLPWEALPSQMLNHAEVWEAMLPTMGLTALVRNLGRLTSLGVIAPMSEQSAAVATRLYDEDQIRRARIHPFTILNALSVYKSSHGFRGHLSWVPVPEIVRALNRAFYSAFDNIEPAGKRTLIALDVSPSMDGSKIHNSSLSAREAAAAMAMVTVRTEPAYMTCAFAGNFVPFTLTPEMELGDVITQVQGMAWNRTDCAIPMLYALKHSLEVETFIIYTDNETWSGKIHPYQALVEYRDKVGVDDARLVVVGLTATEFSIAILGDKGMLDVVGFDTASPNLITDFSRGDI